METGRTGGQLLVACLEAQGITKAFGVPGESYLAVLDAFVDSHIEYLGWRHEGGAAYAASAWGKLLGQPGIAFVTRGPGATNASVGVHTARQDSSPMILFVGQASTAHLGREAFQEVDHRAFFSPIAKWATQVDDVDRIPEIVSRAFSMACGGRPGPVVVALPEDVLAARSTAKPGRPVQISRPGPTPTELAAVVELLENAERPLVLVGGGGWDETGRIALQGFAQANGLPVATVFRSQDLIDNTSASFIGEAGVAMSDGVASMISNADVLLALGIRFGEVATKGFSLVGIPDPAAEVIHVHPSPDELGKVVQASLPIVANPSTFCEALNGAALTPSPSRRAFCESGRATYLDMVRSPPSTSPVDMATVMEILRDGLPADAIITNGAGNFTRWPNRYYSFGANARLLGPQSGSMGYGLPAAIAARLADPGRVVVCFAGDGDFQMTIQELGTAMQHGAQPIVIVVNNASYGTIRMHQEREFPGRVSGTEIKNPDLVQVARAYGFEAVRVEETSGFAPALQRSMASRSGALIELMVDEFPA